MSKMKVQDAEIIKDLIRYGEETAGGLMTPHFNKVPFDNRAADIFTNIRRESNKDIPPYFYVVNESGQLIGFFKLRDLMDIQTSALAKAFIRPTTPKVHLRSEEHTSELQSRRNLVCRLLLEKKNTTKN